MKSTFLVQLKSVLECFTNNSLYISTEIREIVFLFGEIGICLGDLNLALIII